MKKFKKQLLAGILTAVMAVSAFASATPVSAASLSAKQYFSKMNKATEKAKSYEMKMSMDMDMVSGGETSSTKTTTTLITFTDPLKVKSVMNMSVTAGGETTNIKMTSYSKQKNNKLIQYTSTDGKTYAKSTLDLSDYSDMLGSMQSNDMYSGLKIVKKNVTVNGKSTVQIKAAIKGQDIAELLSGLGLEDETQTSYDYSSLAPITVTIWIDKKTYYPVKQTIDMKDFMNGYLASLSTDSDLSYSKIKTTVTYKNFNKATKFSIPKACK